jgi:hypothetical protein
MRRGTTLRFVIGASALALAATAAPGSAKVAASGWERPSLVSKTKAHRETSLAVNPKNADQLFVCDPSGVPNTSEGESYFHRSTNGGKKWHDIQVESSATDTRQYAFEGGDCDVAYDDGGTMWSADTWLGNLSVGHSKDGKTWEGTALAVTSPVVDRPWLVGGPPGTLYVTYQDLQCCTPSAIWFTKTTDNGKTFSPAVPVATLASADGAYTWEGNFVVDKGGQDFYLVYSRRLGGVASLGTPEVMSLVTSHDGGLTWTSKDIARIPRETTSIYPSIGMDKGGYLHVAWAAPGDNDNPVVYMQSKDKGATWSTPKALIHGKSGYAPWVAGGMKKGEAAIVWLGTPSGKPDEDSRWFFYVAKVKGSKVSVGPTTRDPLWEGLQTTPEFEMARYDKYGRLHIGMSVFWAKNKWAVWYQREQLPKKKK